MTCGEAVGVGVALLTFVSGVSFGLGISFSTLIKKAATYSLTGSSMNGIKMSVPIMTIAKEAKITNFFLSSDAVIIGFT